MRPLSLYLFGSFRLLREDVPLVAFRSDKARALLAYLVLEARQPIPRDTLLALFWPADTPAAAQQSLRSTLYNLRQLLDPSFLPSSRLTVHFAAPPDAFWCDALAFEAERPDLLLDGPAPSRPRLERLRDLHSGEFLPSLTLPDCPAFTAWQQARRERYRSQALEARARLRAAASPAPGNLPRTFTPFFGRSSEVEQCAQRLRDPDYPLLTLIGQGGVGKTRLALAVAERLRDHFADGVWFVPLESVAPFPQEAADRGEQRWDPLAAAIGQALGLRMDGAASLAHQLFRALHNRELLLVLDNFEHLIEGADFVLELVRTLPRTTLLVTSRRPLGLQLEYLFQVEGLPTPAPHQPVRGAALSSYSSVQLFVERADRTARGFTLSPRNEGAVVRICQATEGLPLGIELAAALVEQKSCDAIARTLHENIEGLTTQHRDVPPRHRSLRAVFDYSWQLLPVAAARVLARCSLFQGGFAQEAALSVTAARPQELAVLRAHSLLRQEEGGRYTLHALVRQLAAGKLTEEGQAALTDGRDRHSQYYLRLLVSHTEALWRGVPTEELARLAAEGDNFRHAWEWALQQATWEAVQPAVRGISFFFERLGFNREGETMLARALHRLEHSPHPDAQQGQTLRASLLTHHALFLSRLGQEERAVQEAHAALDLAPPPEIQATAHWVAATALRILGDGAGTERHLSEGIALCGSASLELLRGWLLSELGIVAHRIQDHAATLHHFQGALALAQQQGGLWLEASVRTNLALFHMYQGDFWAAREMMAGANAQMERIGYELGRGRTCVNLTSILLRLGDNEAAARTCQEALTIARRVGSVQMQANALVLRTRIAFNQGDDESACRSGAEAVALAQGVGEPFILSVASLFLGHALARSGRLAEARSAYERALELWLSRQQPEGILEPQAALADLALHEGKLAEALRLVEELLALLPTLSLTHEALSEPLRALLTCYQVLVAAHDPRASALLQRLHLLYQEREARLPPAAHPLFRAIPTHRALLALTPPEAEQGAGREPGA